MKDTLLPFLGRTVLWKIAYWLCASLTIQRKGFEKLEHMQREGKNYVVVFWHGSMLLGWFVNRPTVARSVAALVSQSKDGQLLSHVLMKWRYSLIRGSSHIGGKEAMELMTEAVRSGQSLCVTPDGPRGPRHEMKMGAIRIAQKCNVPIVTMGIGLSNKKHLNSWDKFEIPMPFSKAYIVCSEPVMVPDDYTGTALDDFRLRIQKELNDMQRQAEESV